MHSTRVTSKSVLHVHAHDIAIDTYHHTPYLLSPLSRLIGS